MLTVEKVHFEGGFKKFLSLYQLTVAALFALQGYISQEIW
jgi:hypothetical protein